MSYCTEPRSVASTSKFLYERAYLRRGCAVCRVICKVVCREKGFGCFNASTTYNERAVEAGSAYGAPRRSDRPLRLTASVWLRVTEMARWRRLQDRTRHRSAPTVDGRLLRGFTEGLRRVASADRGCGGPETPLVRAG